MKTSNFTTPRSLAECQFFPAADPIERPAPRGRMPIGWVVLAVLLVIAAAFAGRA